jgi:putative cell wall-binding protein
MHINTTGRRYRYAVPVLLAAVLAAFLLLLGPIKPAHAASYTSQVANESELAAALAQGASGDTIDIEVTAPFAVTTELSVRNGKDVTIHGATLTNNVSASTSDIFAVFGATLTLHDITLQGRNGAPHSLIKVYSSLNDTATLNIGDGAVLQDNIHNQNSAGGAITLYDGNLNMLPGAIISGNGSMSGGAIWAGAGGNDADCVVDISGGTITGNTATSQGGAIYISSNASNKTFTMSDGTISNNTAGADGGGVCFIAFSAAPTAFNVSGGVIDGNSSRSGGGIIVGGLTTFTLRNVQITNNTSSQSGGGVYFSDYQADGKTFNIDNCTISGNVAGQTSSGYFGGGIQFTTFDSGYGTNMPTVNITNTTISNNRAGVEDSDNDPSNGLTPTYGSGGGLAIGTSCVTINLDDTTTVSGNLAYDGAATGSIQYGRGGGIQINSQNSSIYVTNLNLNGAEVTGNEARTAAGLYSNCRGAITMSGDARIANNMAVANGMASHNGSYGGVFANAGANGQVAFTLSDQATIANNISMGGSSGIAFAGSLTLEDQSSVSGNVARNGSGGGISGSGNLVVKDDASVSGNIAYRNGGGIYFYGGSSSSVHIEDNASISDNHAGMADPNAGSWYDDKNYPDPQGDGGGISVDSRYQLPSIYTSAGVTFSNNSASRSNTHIAAADQATYDANILSDTWTSPFTQGYNNYDISYQMADPSINGNDFYYAEDAPELSPEQAKQLAHVYANDMGGANVDLSEVTVDAYELAAVNAGKAGDLLPLTFSYTDTNGTATTDDDRTVTCTVNVTIKGHGAGDVTPPDANDTYPPRILGNDFSKGVDEPDISSEQAYELAGVVVYDRWGWQTWPYYYTYSFWNDDLQDYEYFTQFFVDPDGLGQLDAINSGAVGDVLPLTFKYIDYSTPGVYDEQTDTWYYPLDTRPVEVTVNVTIKGHGSGGTTPEPGTPDDDWDGEPHISANDFRATRGGLTDTRAIQLAAAEAASRFGNPVTSALINVDADQLVAISMADTGAVLPLTFTYAEDTGNTVWSDEAQDYVPELKIVSVTVNVTLTADPEIIANDFAPRSDEPALTPAQAIEFGNVEIYDVDGAPVDPAEATVDQDQLDIINNATQNGSYPLTFTYTDAVGNSVSVTIHVTVTGLADPDNAILNVARLFGDDRYGTSEQVATYRRTLPLGGTVILASGEDANFPDALTASALSGLEGDCPIVLTSRDTLSDKAAQALTELAPERAIIVGGTAAVSADTAAAIEKIVADTTRIGGVDRQETAELIYASRPASEWSSDAAEKTAIIATNAKFPDSLSIAPYAAKSASPVFLTEFGNTTLTAETTAALASGGFTRIVVVGESTAVPQSAAEEALAAAGTTNLVRLGGETRYETAVAIANWAIASERAITERLTFNNVTIARGDKHADALAGGALQGFSGSVILLTAEGNRQQAAQAIYAHLTPAITEIRFLGGPAAIPVSVVADYIDLIPHDAINWTVPGTEIPGVN